MLQDQGNPPQYTDTIIYVNIIDADDQNPKFYDERYTATLSDHAVKVTNEHVTTIYVDVSKRLRSRMIVDDYVSKIENVVFVFVQSGHKA